MSFVNVEKASDRDPGKVVEWAKRKKCIPEALARAVMSLHKGAWTKVKVGTRFSEEFELNVGVHIGSVLSPLLYALVADVVTYEIIEGMIQEILYADDIIMIAASMEKQHEKFQGWKSALESKGQKVNLTKTKVMVSKIGQVSVNPSCKKDPCGRKTMLNAVLCKSCGNWINGR